MHRSERDEEESFKKSNNDVKTSIQNQYRTLGPITFYEKCVMALFTLLILLWLFKDPQFMSGWEDAIQTESVFCLFLFQYYYLFSCFLMSIYQPYRHKIGDGTVAIAIVALAFILPAKPNFWCFRSSKSPNGNAIATLVFI